MPKKQIGSCCWQVTIVRKDDGKQFFEALGMVTSLGLGMAAAVAVGLIAGRWLDGVLDSSPWATAAGIILGMLAGLWSIYKQVLRK